MARFDADGCRVPVTLFEAAAWQYAIVASCRCCKAQGVFDPHALWWLFERKGWDQSLARAARRLKCRSCRSSAVVTWSREKTPTIDLPLPSASEWRRALSRFRS